MAKTYLEVHPHSSILILDYAEHLGGTWARERLYPGLKTNNIVGSYEFSDFPLVPQKYGIKPGQHIPGHVVYSYLCDFCDSFGLTSRIRLGSKVESVSLLPDGEWEVAFSRPFSRKRADDRPPRIQTGTLIASRLVLATGLTSEPYMPLLPGRESFEGPIFHAKDFKTRAEELAGVQTVVVIGGNKSAWDVCYSSVTRFGAKAHMIMRRSGGGPSWCWPARMEGHIRSISAASATRLFTWLDPNPYGSTAWPIRLLVNRTWLGRKLSGLFWRYLDGKVTELNAYGQSEATESLRPWSSTFWMGNSLSVHNYETSWFDLARSGQISTHVAEVTSLSGRTVHLSDGTSIEADAVICCTGWHSRPSLKFYPNDIADRLGFPGSHPGDVLQETQARSEILRAAPALRTKPTRRLPNTLKPEQQKHSKLSKAEPASSPYRLYRFSIPSNPDFIRMKNLAVAGAHITLHTAILAQAQALWITAFFDDRIPHLAEGAGGTPPDMTSILRDTYRHTEYQRIRRPRETGGMGDRCPDLVFDSIPFVDVLLSDMEMRCLRKSSWYREVLEPYRLFDYRGLVQEWLAKAGKQQPS